MKSPATYIPAAYGRNWAYIERIGRAGRFRRDGARVGKARIAALTQSLIRREGRRREILALCKNAA
ncbi:hypothetical protein SS05631_c06190 [Sinorhizobium sp. CCBAU 05631]|uniref:hypothetical protein n=1 Tax=Sinorhizobium TaxID=28105 RepID=UPI0004B2FE74|nr:MULTISPECIES: hypothetical protein [Sinorhizobium]ASY55574.1 hypothetical protein SS05631_c06190 [Sinorhizobium sp. CCBAU 05631]